MWLILLTFLLISSASFAVMMLFMRSGRNQASDGPAPGGRRALMFGSLTHALAGMLPIRPENRQRYSRFLRQSGHYHSEAVTEFLALRNVLVVGSLLLVVTTIVVATDPGDTAMVALAVGGTIVVALLFAVPRLALESMAKNRTRRIEEGLPDAMDMVTMCMSAGLPLQHAISRVSGEMQSSHPDLAFELRIVGRQTEAGSLNSAIQQVRQTHGHSGDPLHRGHGLAGRPTGCQCGRGVSRVLRPGAIESASTGGRGRQQNVHQNALPAGLLPGARRVPDAAGTRRDGPEGILPPREAAGWCALRFRTANAVAHGTRGNPGRTVASRSAGCWTQDWPTGAVSQPQRPRIPEAANAPTRVDEPPAVSLRAGSTSRCFSHDLATRLLLLRGHRELLDPWRNGHSLGRSLEL